jgi:hypothetical protein
MLNGVVGFRFIGKRVAQGSGRLFHVSLYINRDNVYYGKYINTKQNRIYIIIQSIIHFF